MTSTKLDLLLKLLLNRNEAVILHQGKVLCSCGDTFTDMSDIENHLVQDHEKLSETSTRRTLQEVLQTVITSGANDQIRLEQFDTALEPKSFAVCLDEDQIGGGSLESINCPECSTVCWSFKTLKNHFIRQHPGLWPCQETCQQISRILFTKPSKDHQNRLPKGWSYHFYCPIPSCKYHLKQKKMGEEARWFSTRSLLKQHYSKIHAFKSKICQTCGTGKFLQIEYSEVLMVFILEVQAIIGLRNFLPSI